MNKGMRTVVGMLAWCYSCRFLGRFFFLAEDGIRVVAVTGVRACALPIWSVVAILGPNGAGKTTLLKVISGAMRPSAGTVCMEGHDVTGAGAERLARAGLCLIPEGRGDRKSVG